MDYECELLDNVAVKEDLFSGRFAIILSSLVLQILIILAGNVLLEVTRQVTVQVTSQIQVAQTTVVS